MEVIVNIEEGKTRGKRVVGLKGDVFYSFQGIPYAKPPLGNLRFKAPRPIEKWSGIKDCTQEASSPYSRHMIYQNIIGSEDCLILNVFTKDIPQSPTSNKPVMVWIYGGGFVQGSSALYGPDFFMTKDVVLVTINYRVGIFGFLSFDDPDLGVPGNAGLKDQVMALQWVQRNIKNFGGDSGNVTIFGESAGAASVHFLILSPMAKGLFHKAIVQSGSALCPWSLANNPLNKVLVGLQCPYTNQKDILKFLQEQPVEKLLSAQDQIGDHLNLYIKRDYGPIVEKPSEIEPNFITEHPVDILMKESYNKVPIMFGYTNREGMILNFYNKFDKRVKLTTTNFEEIIPNNFNIQFGSDESKKIAEKIKQFYYGNEEPSETNTEKFLLMHGDIFFTFGIQYAAEYHVRTSKEPVYLYRFSVEGQRNLYKIISEIELPGASHVDELAYLFNMPFPEYLKDKIISNSLDDITIKRMIEFWTNFAKTGNPNPTEKNKYVDVTWQPVTKDVVNFIDIGSDLSVDTSPDNDRMKFWNEIYSIANKY